MLVRQFPTSFVLVAVAYASLPPQFSMVDNTPPASTTAPGIPAQTKPDKMPPMAPSVTVMDATGASGILGRAVKGADGKDMGRIVDVIVDTSGQVRAAVIDFGGFLGVGSRKIAVDWKALHFNGAVKRGDDVRLELTRDQIKAAPEYKEGKPLVVIGPSGDLRPLGVSTPAPAK